MTAALDITPPSSFTDGRPWLDRDPPVWGWPAFAEYRCSIFDWRSEPDLQREVTVVDAVETEGVDWTSRGIEVRGRITASHRERKPVFA